VSAAVACGVPRDEERAAPRANAAVNPCALCAPLGAALATLGLAGSVPILHGGQGCATYIRRYLISHFREPVDIASSSFGEAETVFGGQSHLVRALGNVVRQYHPELITVATTCVAETIGEDLAMMLKGYRERGDGPPVVHAHTPSYTSSHIEGFHIMVRALVEQLAIETGPRLRAINVLPALLSPADLRYLREIVVGFGVEPIILPDYSQTLDGAVSERYQAIQPGGTPLAQVRRMARSLATLDLTLTGRAPRASDIAAERGCPAMVAPLPVGVRATDAFVAHLASASGTPAPAWLEEERGRLLDAYADGHKYVFGKRVAVYGEPELVAGLARFLLEVGASPVVCATGARNRALSMALAGLPAGSVDTVLEDTDFSSLETACRGAGVELLVGNSKGYRSARALGVPLLRLGFPVHDRFGAARSLIVGYRGSLELFDALVNAVLTTKQEADGIGFSYL
jgi:nitrogenase molybdenum-iron protein NifN